MSVCHDEDDGQFNRAVDVDVLKNHERPGLRPRPVTLVKNTRRIDPAVHEIHLLWRLTEQSGSNERRVLAFIDEVLGQEVRAAGSNERNRAVAHSNTANPKFGGKTRSMSERGWVAST